MTPQQRLLKLRHGTPSEFEFAALECLGEVSLAEARQAINKYRREWRLAGSNKSSMKKYKNGQYPVWIKIIVHFALDFEKQAQAAARCVAGFEEKFEVKHLYYARYTTLDSSTAEVSALTAARVVAIKKFFLACEGVRHVEIERRDSGSLAHAYAYQAVKRLPSFESDIANDNDFADVLHWCCNMRGLDYIREARFYSFRSLCLLHQMATENAQNVAVMRRFNMDVAAKQKAETLTERLNLLGKGRAKARSSRPGPQPKRKRSCRVVSRTTERARRARLSGSARR